MVEQTGGFIEKMKDYVQKTFQMFEKINGVLESITNSELFKENFKLFLQQNGISLVNEMQYDFELKQNELKQQIEKFQDAIPYKINSEEGFEEIIQNNYHLISLYQNLNFDFKKIQLLFSYLKIDIEFKSAPSEMKLIDQLLKRIEQIKEEKDQDKFKEDLELVKSAYKKIISGPILDEIKKIIQRLQKNIDTGYEDLMALAQNPQVNSLPVLKLEDQESQERLESQQNPLSRLKQGEKSYEGHKLLYLKMLQDFLSQTMDQNDEIIGQLESLEANPENPGNISYCFNWVKDINDQLMQEVKLRKEGTYQNFKERIIQVIEEFCKTLRHKSVKQECKIQFLNTCNQLADIFKDTQLGTNKIFSLLQATKKQQNPKTEGEEEEEKRDDSQLLKSYINSQQNDQTLDNIEQSGDIFAQLTKVVGQQLIELKQYTNTDLDDIKTEMLQDVKLQFQKLEGSSVVTECKSLISQTSLTTNVVDFGSITSMISARYSDNNWRIRDRIVLILFDLHRIYENENTPQTFGNALIQLRVKEVHEKVQGTLKNEDMLLEMKAILCKNWKTQEAEIKQYM